MDNNTWILLIIGIGMAILVIVILFTMSRNNLKQQMAVKDLLEKTQKSQDEQMHSFQDRMSNQMLTYQSGMTNSIRQDLNRLNESTTDRLNRIDARVNDSLMKGFEKTNASFSSIKEQMARIDETQQTLKGLSQNIQSLQNVLTDKKTRGTYGEVELYSLMKQVFGDNTNRYQSQYKLSTGAIADCVLFAPDPLGKIVIDSKFPLENYNRLFEENLSGNEKEAIRASFRKDVKKHITDIATKYILPGETAEVAYMFVPAEAVFAEIYGHFDEIVQYSYEKNVFIVSPTTLMAYLTAIRAIYLGQERNEKVEEIQREYIRLSKEFERFNNRFESVSSDFQRTFKDMQEVQVTSGKIIRRFHDIEAVKLDHPTKESELPNGNQE